MLEFIRLFPEDDHTAGILLDGEYEQFNLNLVDWSKEDYIDQWKHAAKYSLKNREILGFIKNYENAYHHVKMIGIYTIIPEELTNPQEFLISEEGCDFLLQSGSSLLPRMKRHLPRMILLMRLKNLSEIFFLSIISTKVG